MASPIPTEILTAAGGDLLFHEGRDLMKKFFETEAGKKVFEAVGAKAKKMFDADDCRVDMLNFIYITLRERHSGIPAANIATYLTNALKDPLGDNTVVKNMCLAFEKTRAKNPDGTCVYPDPKDDQQLLDVFEELGLLSEKEFRERLEHYDHDPAEQLLKYVGRQIKKGIDKVGQWTRWFIAYALVWPLALMIIAAATESRMGTWIVGLFPAIVLLFIALFGVNPLYIILGNKADERYRLGFLSTAWSAVAIHVGFALYLGYFPIKSMEFMLLLYVAATGFIFARLGKGSLVTLVRLACLGLIIFVFWANHHGVKSADAASVQKGISAAKELVGMGPGSSQSNPIVLDFSKKPIPLEVNSTTWFQINPGGWTQRITRPDNSFFRTKCQGDNEQERYVEARGENGQWVYLIDGPQKRPDYPPNSTAIRFRAADTTLVKITVLPVPR